ncbi:hypothetical protein ACP70R_050198 [Stipagrostis hirtigluma subsp. patula]
MFGKSVACCYNAAPKQGQTTFFFFRIVVCTLESGLYDWLSHRPPPPGSTPVASSHQYQWPAQPSHRFRAICNASGALPVAVVESTGAGTFGGLLRRCRRAEHLLLQCVSHFIFIVSIVVFFLTDIYKRLAAPATDQLPRSTGAYAGDGIVACTPEFEEIIVVASKYRIRCGSQSWLSWATKSWLSWATKLAAVVQGLANAGRLNGAALGNIFWQVTSTEHTFSVAKEVQPKKRPEPDTCVIVAITVAMEAKHRFMYGLPWTAAEPEHLLERCRKGGIWTPENGASITGVLAKVRSLRGVPIVTENPDVNRDPARCPRLPLTSWQKHEATGLCPELVAELLDRGPCVARIYPSYYDSGEEVVFHAVVCFGYRRHAVDCFGYRLCHYQMQVHVLDNDDETGPWRWIHLARIHTIYTLDVGCLDSHTVHLQVKAASSQGRARV